MNLLRCFLAAMTLGFAAGAAADPVHNMSAASSAKIEVTADDTVVMQARNARLVPYVLYDGDAHRPRLATITSDVTTRTDAEGPDPKSTVSFEVQDLAAAEPKRLSSFTEPGTEGSIVAERYGVATMPGCCGGTDLHRVHALESGTLLFRSTGDGALGSAAWAEAPNAKPRTVRWAAFDGDVGGKEAAAGLLGRIVYGGDDGPLSTIELRSKARDDDLAMGLAHNAVLVWIDPKADPKTAPPSSGTADSPQSLWVVEGVAEPARLGGFQLALMLDKKRLATIPIAADRLAAKDAKTTGAVAVRAAAVR